MTRSQSRALPLTLRSWSLHTGVRAVALVLALVCSGCVAKPARLGDTHVGKGELYRAGRPRYDAFFVQTHAVQRDAMASLDEERRARAPLEKVMGEAAPSASVLGDRVVARAQKQRSAPTSAPDDATFAQALTTALQAEGSVAKKYDDVATRASALTARADELLLASERDFAQAKHREEVARELNAAKLILRAAALRTRTVSNDAEAFVKAAGEARDSAPRDKILAAAPAAAVSKPEKRGPARGPVKSTKTPSSAAEVGRAAPPDRTPAARATPPPSPQPTKTGEDFNP